MPQNNRDGSESTASKTAKYIAFSIKAIVRFTDGSSGTIQEFVK
jgi:hypothetical protein